MKLYFNASQSRWLMMVALLWKTLAAPLQWRRSNSSLFLQYSSKRNYDEDLQQSVEQDLERSSREGGRLDMDYINIHVLQSQYATSILLAETTKVFIKCWVSWSVGWLVVVHPTRLPYRGTGTWPMLSPLRLILISNKIVQGSRSQMIISGRPRREDGI